MVLPFFSPAGCFGGCGSGRGEEPSGGNVLRLIQIRLTTSSLEKIPPASQANSPQARIADSNSINAVSLSSACTTNRFPSSRCASAIQIVRPLESIAETQPQLQPALLRLSAMISQDFTQTIVSILVCGRQAKRDSASKMPNDLAQFSPCSLLIAFPSGRAGNRLQGCSLILVRRLRLCIRSTPQR
jgi:hypothetical protein